MLPSLFQRIEEFRDISISDIARFYGAGYRVRARFCSSPWLGKPPPGLSRRWWRLWLVIHSPFGIRPLSWEWWFSAGRSAPVLHQWVATLRSRVLLSFFDRLGSSNYITIDDSLEGFDRFTIEVMFYAPWVKLHLDSLSTKLVAIILGKDPKMVRKIGK